MEYTDSEEPEKKKPHLSNNSLVMARNSTVSPENKCVDAAVLQYQNQRLVQQLDRQKHELRDLEGKTQELKQRQSSYDDALIILNRLWNQLVDDLVLLGIRAGRGQNALQTLDDEDKYRGTIPPCPPEDIFLCRLLRVNSLNTSGADGIVTFAEEALAQRHASTMELMKLLQDTVEAQKMKTESIAKSFNGNLSAEDVVALLNEADHLMKEEADVLQGSIDLLHSKHKDYLDQIQKYIQSDSADQAEMKRLSVELEESMSDLEEKRRKLVNLQMEKNAAAEVYSPASGATNGNLSHENSLDREMGIREMKDLIEEAKIVAEDRLVELEDAEQEHLILSKQLEDLEKEIKDERYVYSSRLYILRNDQLHHWRAEAERYKALADSLKADKPTLVRRERELESRADSAAAAKAAIDNAEEKVRELELQLEKALHDRNDLEIKMEEASQDSRRNDIKSEFNVMTSALTKEKEMMEVQLNRWKETAGEALALREKAQSLKALLNAKAGEVRVLEDKCAEQMADIKSLKELIETLQQEKLELEIIVNLHGQEIYVDKNIAEIQESERRARSQAEVLRHALDEHSLELRVKAAKEAEAACQKRLSAAEAEIADLRAELDATERDVIELTEAIRVKDIEAEAYISEIETIGQAYEDMQTQNRHLLQQMTERDDYNIKLVSESVKLQQAQSALLLEKDALTKQLQQLDTSLDYLRTRISQSEAQMKAMLSEAMSSAQEDRKLAVDVEATKWQLADAEKELKWLKSTMSSSEKEYEQVQQEVDETQKELDRERSEKQKLEEELKEWNEKVEQLSAQSGEAAIQKLQDDIKECKSILKCGVCFDRPKEVVIVKCYHLFCNQCIQRNLEIRHRKCPACGTAFGQNDVRMVKI